MNQKGMTLIELLVSIVILGVLVAIIFWPLIGGAIHYSSGKRVGYLVKWSERGLLIKNWCGELSIGGQGQAGYVFDFGINRNENNQALVSELNSLDGQKVEVTYDQRAKSNPFNGCSDYLVTNVKLLK